MQEIIKSIEIVAADELKAANEKFPLFRSKHEAYGVLLEEFREAETEWEMYRDYIRKVEDETFADNDENARKNREMARYYALYCTAELIQNIAMLDKWTVSENRKENNNE